MNKERRGSNPQMSSATIKSTLATIYLKCKKIHTHRLSENLHTKTSFRNANNVLHVCGHGMMARQVVCYILSSTDIMSLVLGRFPGLSLIHLSMRDTMAGQLIRLIWAARLAVVDSGNSLTLISTSRTPKLNTSILGE